MSPDLVNACFELGGAALIWANVRALYAAWGLWNVFYYPAIGQTLSFWAGLGVVAGNLTWCALAWRYREKRAPQVDYRRRPWRFASRCMLTGEPRIFCACAECNVAALPDEAADTVRT